MGGARPAGRRGARGADHGRRAQAPLFACDHHRSGSGHRRVPGRRPAGLRLWPDERQAARVVDRHFELHDRLTTALELHDSDLPLSILQRTDARRRTEGLRLSESAAGQLKALEGGAAALPLAVFLVLALIGLPSAGTHASALAQSGNQVKKAARTGVPRVIKKANQGLSPTAKKEAALRNLNLALRRLRAKLREAPNKAAALRAISATQQQLHRIASSLHPIKPAAVSQLNHALSSHMTRASGRRPPAARKRPFPPRPIP